MNINSILSELKAERTRFDRAITAIQSLTSPNGHRKATPAGKSTTRKSHRRRLSATSRARLSRLMKQRWAQGKMGKKANANARPAKRLRRVSATARRKMAAAQRARWAKVKAQQRDEKKSVAKAA